MSAAKWFPEFLDDLSGMWVYWDSPVGRMVIERGERKYVCGYCPRDEDIEADRKVGTYATLSEAKADAVRWVLKEGKRRLASAERLRKALARLEA